MNSGAGPAELHAFFLDGAAGRLFCIYRGPARGTKSRGGVLLVPPFAEELNKSRRQVSLQVQALAASGYAVLVVDLFGTGDSEGDFSEGLWELWLDDLRRGADWLMEHGADRLILWGVRLGAILAADLREQLSYPVGQMLLWAPVVKGRQHLSQFLRLRVVAEMMSGTQTVSTREIEEQLRDGASVEVAGYEMNPDLFTAIVGRDLTSASAEGLTRVDWFEIVAGQERPMPAVARGALETWRERGVEAHVEAVVGEPFWSTPEIAVVPELVDRTLRCLASDGA